MNLETLLYLTMRFRRISLRNSVHKARIFPTVPNGIIRPGQIKLTASSGVMAFSFATESDLVCLGQTEKYYSYSLSQNDAQKFIRKEDVCRHRIDVICVFSNRLLDARH